MERLVSSLAFVTWTIHATELPRVLRHCRRCDASRAFVSSGKFRVNAQKRRLDVWLVHRCAGCDDTWNAALHERVLPEELGAVLDGYHENDAALARRAAFAVPGADRAVAFTVERPPLAAGPLAIMLRLADPVTLRLDRLLARELGRPRTALAHHRGRVCDG